MMRKNFVRTTLRRIAPVVSIAIVFVLCAGWIPGICTWAMAEKLPGYPLPVRQTNQLACFDMPYYIAIKCNADGSIQVPIDEYLEYQLQEFADCGMFQEEYYLGLLDEIRSGYEEMLTYDDYVAVAAGVDWNIAGLRSNGTVVVGMQSDGQDLQHEVREWADITAIAVGTASLLGLRKDGTVLSGGVSAKGVDTSSWQDIIQIDFDCIAVGLRSDGRVVYEIPDGYYGSISMLEEAERWTDIVQVATSSSHIIGLKADGTVVAAGDNYFGQGNVEDWTDIVQIATAYYHTVGLKGDGTVVAAGYQPPNDRAYYSEVTDVANLKNVCAVYASCDYTIVVYEDGLLDFIGDSFRPDDIMATDRWIVAEGMRKWKLDLLSATGESLSAERYLSIDAGYLQGLSANAAGGRGMTINVSSDTDWSVSIAEGADWISLSTSGGSGNGSFFTEIAANGAEERVGWIEVSAPGCETIRIKVTQGGGPTAAEASAAPADIQRPGKPSASLADASASVLQGQEVHFVIQTEPNAWVSLYVNGKKIKNDGIRADASGQALYNRAFSTVDDDLQVQFSATLGDPERESALSDPITLDVKAALKTQDVVVVRTFEGDQTKTTILEECILCEDGHTYAGLAQLIQAIGGTYRQGKDTVSVEFVDAQGRTLSAMLDPSGLSQTTGSNLTLKLEDGTDVGYVWVNRSQLDNALSVTADQLLAIAGYHESAQYVYSNTFDGEASTRPIAFPDIPEHIYVIEEGHCKLEWSAVTDAQQYAVRLVNETTGGTAILDTSTAPDHSITVDASDLSPCSLYALHVSCAVGSEVYSGTHRFQVTKQYMGRMRNSIDGGTNEIEVDYSFGPEAFQEEASTYSPGLALASSIASAAAYASDEYQISINESYQREIVSQINGEYIYKMLSDLGFTDIEMHNYDNISKTDYDRDNIANQKHAVGYVFAHKPVYMNGDNSDLYAIIIRGTTGSEWFSNFEVCDPSGKNGFLDSYHFGFKTAADDVLQSFKEYYVRRNDSDTSDNLMWITGHSRGAAVANYVAGNLSGSEQYADRLKTYAYTFATPNFINRKVDDIVSEKCWSVDMSFAASTTATIPFLPGMRTGAVRLSTWTF